MHYFTLFVMDIHQNRPIFLFSTSFDHYQSWPLVGLSCYSCPMIPLFFLMHRFSDLTDKSFLESGNPGLYEGGSFCSRRQERWAATKTSAAKTAAAPKTSSCTLLFCKTSSHFQNAGTPPEEEKLSFVNRRAIDVTF